MLQNTYEVGGKAYPVTGFHAISGVGAFPVVDIPLTSDYAWQLGALESRLRHPERYEGFEDVTATVERLKAYLEEHRDIGEREGLYRKYLSIVGGVIS